MEDNYFSWLIKKKTALNFATNILFYTTLRQCKKLNQSTLKLTVYMKLTTLTKKSINIF